MKPYGLYLGACLVLSLGCGSHKLSSGERACKQVCKKLEVCNDATDVPGCEDTCTGETFRSDAYFAAKARCVDTLACNHLTGELDTSGQDTCTGAGCQVEDCIDDGLASQKPSPDDSDLCSRMSNKLSACDRTLGAAELEEQCMAVVHGMSDDYLTESTMCIDLACDAISTCLDQTADRYNTTLRIFAGRVK
jgi:hypothetical protein